MLSSNSAQLLLYPMVSGFRGRRNAVCLTEPQDCKNQGSTKGGGRNWAPFFGLNSTGFSSEEIGTFRCAKCLFLESQQSQSHLIDFSYLRGKAIYSFLCFFLWGSSPKSEVSSGKARGVLTVLVLQIVRWTYFPLLLVISFIMPLMKLYWHIYVLIN